MQRLRAVRHGVGRAASHGGYKSRRLGSWQKVSHCGDAIHAESCSFDLTKKCFPHTFLAPQAAKNLSVRLNTCLNTSFLVSTPADQHLFPRLNAWLLNAESCLNVEPTALYSEAIAV